MININMVIQLICVFSIGLSSLVLNHWNKRIFFYFGFGWDIDELGLL